ncbi:hypothetical protein [Nonomuraea sp. NPDC049400]|uniref:hypothetical protein n=1 Tax=Nonomuraea sp. NPDC049400 TaxID=3364352 RepID=UPI00379723C2
MDAALYRVHAGNHRATARSRREVPCPAPLPGDAALLMRRVAGLMSATSAPEIYDQSAFSERDLPC